MAPELPKMQYRFLGRSGLQVSAISLGGWLTYGGHVGNEAAFDCMKAAYDAGINFFDCAEAYAEGKSEKVMGEAIKHFGQVQGFPAHDVAAANRQPPAGSATTSSSRPRSTGVARLATTRSTTAASRAST
jgi:diketogulonate reductase-like aldo/keto reductase